jgi:flagellar motility protein MotE (MotC chaperone)
MAVLSLLAPATIGWVCAGWFSATPVAAQAASDVTHPSTDQDAALQQATRPVSSHATENAGSSENGNDPSRLQGPALTVPREIIDMLDQRKRHLDRREASLRGAEERLLALKAELEQILTKNEQLAAAQKQKGGEAQRRNDERKLSQERVATESRHLHQTQLAKIYESMPAEEAAASLERMPERKAIELLRILKGKSAGAILAAVRPERAARLTEQLLAPP